MEWGFRLKPIRESPRLCRGGSRSLTFAGVHRFREALSRGLWTTLRHRSATAFQCVEEELHRLLRKS